MKTNVKNLVGNKGNSIPNQFQITTSKGRYFQSYNSIIVFIPNNGNRIELGSDWEYSTTTGEYRNLFLNEDKKTTERKLKEGIYILNNNL